MSIKLFVDFKPSPSGAGRFCSRLVPALKKLGVLIRSSKDCNIALWIIRERTPVKVKSVLRIDGVYLAKDDGKLYRNKLVKKALRIADCVIFQSKYSKLMAENVLGIEPRQSKIIYNGANPSNYTPDDKLKFYKRNVIVSNRYAATEERRHKRTKEMFKIAVEYCKMRKDVGFWFAGKIRGKAPDGGKQIKFIGNVPEEKLRKYVATADVMLHLSWLDYCPNSVVEALVAGTPVICAGGSGTEEIVGNAGSILNLGLPPLGIVKNLKPPSFKYELVYNALDKWLEKRVRIAKPELHIDNIARQYKEVFEEVLQK